MGEKTLVESQLNEAGQLIKKLDTQGLSPSLVAWYYYDDVDEWRLLIAGPAFDALLPNNELDAYRQLAEAITSINLRALAVSDIKLLRADSPLPRTMRSLIRTDASSIVLIHLMEDMLNGIYIKDAYLLRSAP